MDSSSNDSNSTISIYSSSDSSSYSSSYSQITSTPVFQNIDKKFISHNQVLREINENNLEHLSRKQEFNRTSTSEDDLFNNVDFLNMLNHVEKKKKANDSVNELFSLPCASITCFQKKRKYINEDEHSVDSLESILSNKRPSPSIEYSQELEEEVNMDLKEPYLSL